MTSRDKWIDSIVAYCAILDKVDLTRLDKDEKKFIETDVQSKLKWGNKLTQHQQLWLNILIKKYPQANTIPDYEWP